MSHGSPAEIVSFERFLERRQRLAHVVPPPDNIVPPAWTDPANAACQDNEPHTTNTIAVACQVPDRTI